MIEDDDYINLSKEALNEYYRDACRDNDLELVEFLLNSPKVKENADMHYAKDWGFSQACIYCSLEVIKYLLTSPDLKENINIYENKCDSFNCVLESNHRDKLQVLEYLIFDYKIEYNDDVKKYVEATPYQQMFEQRDLNKKLDIELPKKETVLKQKI